MRIAELLKEYTHPAFVDWEKFLTRKGFHTMGGRATGGEIVFINQKRKFDRVVIRLHPLRGPIGWIRYNHNSEAASGQNLHSLYNELDIH